MGSATTSLFRGLSVQCFECLCDDLLFVSPTVGGKIVGGKTYTSLGTIAKTLRTGTATHRPFRLARPKDCCRSNARTCSAWPNCAAFPKRWGRDITPDERGASRTRKRVSHY